MGIIGSVFVGLTRVYGVGRDRKIIDIPEDGLVAWYDPSDYVTGTTTWEDRSNNYLDLTLSGTTTAGTNTISLSGITGISPSTSLLSSNTDLTVIQLNRFTADTVGLASWSIGEGKVSNRINELKANNGSPASNLGVMSLWAGDGNKGLVASDNISLPANFQPGGAQSILPYTWPYPRFQWTNVQTSTPSPYYSMFSYRFGNGFLPGTAELGIIDNGDGACYDPGGGTCYPVDTMLGTSINDNINTDVTNPAGSNTNYDLGSSSTIRINGVDSTTGILTGGTKTFGPTIVYNRKITDSELTEIVDYYRSRYDLRE